MYRNFLDELKVGTGANLVLHSNAALGLGLREAGEGRRFLDELEGAVGSAGVIALPAFSYSFPKGETFSRNLPVGSDMGLLSQLAMQRGYHRIEDPMFSFLVRAPKPLEFEPGTNSSNGSSGTFGRFFNRSFQVLSIGLDLGTTLIHEIEHQCRVPYRFTKFFEGKISRNGNSIRTSWAVFVRDLENPASNPDFSRLNRLLENNGALRRSKAGRRSSYSWSLDFMAGIIRQELERTPDFLIRG